VDFVQDDQARVSGPVRPHDGLSVGTIVPVIISEFPDFFPDDLDGERCFSHLSGAADEDHLFLKGCQLFLLISKIISYQFCSEAKMPGEGLETGGIQKIMGVSFGLPDVPDLTCQAPIPGVSTSTIDPSIRRCRTLKRSRSYVWEPITSDGLFFK
jgi:hypothetical protein